MASPEPIPFGVRADAIGGPEPAFASLLEKLRYEEICSVRRWLPQNGQVIEIGGGDGFQARVLASWHCRVSSLDVPDRPRSAEPHYPVQDYDGFRLPFEDGTFDVAFSSNVLEHVSHLPDLISETGRVLKAEGLAIHVVPTPWWRLWTSLVRPVAVLRTAPSMRGVPPAHASDGITDRPAGRRALARAIHLLAGAPHGEYPNALSELYYYSASRWLRVFRDSGFEPVSVSTSGIFYTGYSLWPTLSARWRRLLARAFGSATYVFVLRPVARSSMSRVDGTSDARQKRVTAS